jgi:hypothetical protein
MTRPIDPPTGARYRTPSHDCLKQSFEPRAPRCYVTEVAVPWQIFPRNRDAHRPAAGVARPSNDDHFDVKRCGLRWERCIFVKGSGAARRGNPWLSLPNAVVAREPCCHGGPKMAKIVPLPRKFGEYSLMSPMDRRLFSILDSWMRRLAVDRACSLPPAHRAAAAAAHQRAYRRDFRRGVPQR